MMAKPIPITLTEGEARQKICPLLSAHTGQTMCIVNDCMFWAFIREPKFPRLTIVHTDFLAKKKPDIRPEGVGPDWSWFGYHERDDGAYIQAHWTEDEQSYLKRCNLGDVGVCCYVQ